MPQQVINIGSGANDGTGDPLRTAFDKINDNFSEVYATTSAGSNLDVSDNDIEAVNSNGDINLMPNGTGTVNVIGDLSVSTLLNNQVVYMSGGVLTTNASFLYSSSTLTVGNVTTTANTISTASGDLNIDSFTGLTNVLGDLIVPGVSELAALRVFNNTISAIDSNSNVVLDPSGSGKVTIASNNLRIVESNVPATAIGAVGDQAGDVAWGPAFIYVCTADYDGSTAVWKRSPIAAW